MTRLDPGVRIVEVGPRDGLQNIKQPVPTEVKIEFIQRLRETGLQVIELTSVVSPKRIPQLADCQQVLMHPAINALLQRPHDLRLPVLIPNIKGLEIALSHGVSEVAVFVSATEGFSKANTNCSVEQGIQRARSVAAAAIAANVAVRGYVSCIFEDPYDGPTPLASVLHCVRELLNMGCYEVSLGDTTGVGTPAQTATLIEYLVQHGVSVHRLAGHFHDTYGKGVANVMQAYLCGIRAFDSSVGGLGGCPFAPGAKGNVATEDLLYMFQNAGIDTGINLSRLIETGDWISQHVSPSHARQIGRARASKHGTGGMELSTLGLVTELVDGPKDLQPIVDDLLMRLGESASEATRLSRKLARIDWPKLEEGRRHSSFETTQDRVRHPDLEATFECRGVKLCDGDVGASLHDISKL